MSKLTVDSSRKNKQQGITGIIPKRQLAAAVVGNFIEWFDWAAYALLSIYFASQFFPENAPPLVALLGTFGILAIGFLVRPVAGLVVGKIADRFGRKFALLLTVYGMGISGLIIGLAPTYEQVGILAPIILLFARIMQGVCIGGEYAAMSAFAMEMSPQGRRGFIAGVLSAFGFAGQMAVATLVTISVWVLSPEQMTSWGWRAIFIFGALLSIGGIWIRRGMEETLDTDKDHAEPLRIFDALKKNPMATVKVVGLTIGFTAMVYAWGTYMPAYAMTYKGLDPRFSMTAIMISFAIAGIAAVGAGLLSDKLGRKKTMLFAGIVLAIGTVPAMNFLNDSLLRLVVLQGVAHIILALLQASSMPAYTELFPTKFRASGLGFPYSMTVGLVGGTAPLVGTYFASIGWLGTFPWYLSILMGISVIFYATMKETAFSPLPK